MKGKLARAELALTAIIETARARSNRRAAATSRRPAPNSGALAPPAPETFEATTTAYDGEQTQVVATTAPGNHVAGRRLPDGEPYDAHLDAPGSLSIAEDGGHPANQGSRPIAWLVVTLIALAFAVVGLGLVFLWPWLFVAGLAAVVATSLAGWGVGIMADRGDPRETREAISTKRM
jgi:hypothetical protein